jgi:hypothetical protein
MGFERGFLAPREQNALDLDFAVQDVGIEEPRRADELDAGGLAGVILDQEQLVPANVFRAELVRRFAKVFGELGDISRALL